MRALRFTSGSLQLFLSQRYFTIYNIYEKFSLTLGTKQREIEQNSIVSHLGTGPAMADRTQDPFRLLFFYEHHSVSAPPQKQDYVFSSGQIKYWTIVSPYEMFWSHCVPIVFASLSLT